MRASKGCGPALEVEVAAPPAELDPEDAPLLACEDSVSQRLHTEKRRGRGGEKVKTFGAAEATRIGRQAGPRREARRGQVSAKSRKGGKDSLPCLRGE